MIIHGDNRDVLPTLDSDSVDLVVTSPPYADQRKHDYGGTRSDQYIDWFLVISLELLRVLKPTGSFILNIKEKVTDGQRDTYVIELILALKRQGWRWTEEFVWHKKNPVPNGCPTRLKDGWERLLHFTKTPKFKIFPDNVRRPISDATKDRMSRLNDKNDILYHKSANGSGFGVNKANMLGQEYARPSNVLYLASETQNQGHTAVFPIGIPRFFIELLTEQQDLVLDPFAGSGTTILAALEATRRAIGIEKEEKYCRLAEKRITGVQPVLLGYGVEAYVG